MTINTIKKKILPVLKRYGVSRASLFGSVVRGEATKRSDIDILVTFAEPNDIDLLDLIALKQFLSRKLKKKVDVVQKHALKARIRDSILQETIYV